MLSNFSWDESGCEKKISNKNYTVFKIRILFDLEYSLESIWGWSCPVFLRTLTRMEM